jgi:putative flippase GtrA
VNNQMARFLAQAARFGVSGGVVALVNAGTMTVLVAIAGVPAQLALLISYVLGLAIHFTLNRQWVFSAVTRDHLRLSAQGVRYVTSAASIYVFTAVALAVLPHALGIRVLAVYYLTVVVLAVANFLVLRRWVFRIAP